jgi:hypothetical protein
MSAKKVKVDISDNQGNKFTVTFEGKITRQKILQLFDMIEILGGVEHSAQVAGFFPNQSKFDKVSKLIQDHHPTGWITSKDVQSTYHEIYGELIGLSTVSTYLNRLSKRGKLQKTGSAKKRYRLLKDSSFVDDVIRIKP